MRITLLGLTMAALVAALLALAGAAEAKKLYAATAHEESDGRSAGVLYVVDPATGRSRMIGPIRIDGAEAVAVDGLAVHPKSGVLYAITAGPPGEPRLITIDTLSARAKLIGALGERGADMQFDASGQLYTWLLNTGRLGVIDLATGKVKPLGKTDIPPSRTAGLAINPQGLAIVAARVSKGILDEVDPATGAVVGGLALIDASIINAVNALSIAPGGALFAVNTSKEGRAKRELVSIDTESGSVTKIGALPDDVDAIAFDHDPQETRHSKLGLFMLMATIFIALNLVGWYRWRNSG
jgi:hypothetical protein